MFYAISDLHGCYEKYMKMIKRIALGGEDTLYVLGDVIDRGTGGIKILLDMMRRPNIRPFIGNHESLALGVMKRYARSPDVAAAARGTEARWIWMLCGGAPTERAFCALGKETQRAIIRYIESFSIYDEITVGGRQLHLSHTLPEYDPERSIHDVSYLEFIHGEPNYEVTYADDTLFVSGHTPTNLIDPTCQGKIYKKNNHIVIDCGAAFGNPLGCICLDTLEEFYVQ